MYNDEQNLYHYTYRKDGTEPGQRYDAKQPTVDEQLGSYRQQQEQQLIPEVGTGPEDIDDLRLLRRPHIPVLFLQVPLERLGTDRPFDPYRIGYGDLVVSQHPQGFRISVIRQI